MTAIHDLEFKIYNHWTIMHGSTTAKQLVYDMLSILDPKRWVKQSFRQKRWDGYFRMYNTASGYLYTGMLNYVLDRLEKEVISVHPGFLEYKTTDERIYSEPLGDSWNLPDITLRDYQVDALKAIFSAPVRCRGIIQAATNSGKTEILLGLTKYMGRKTLYVCPNYSPLAEQTYKRFVKRGFTDVSLYHGKLEDLDAQVVVSNIQILYSRKLSIVKFLESVEVLLIDEVHTAQSKSYHEVMRLCSNAYTRIGVSGTPFKGDVYTDLMVTAGLGGVVYKISNDSLIKRGFSAKPIIKFIEYDDKLFEFPKEPKPKYDFVYNTCIVKNNERTSLLANIAKQVVDFGDNVIIFCTLLDHIEKIGMLLRNYNISFEVVTGDTDGRERIKASFENRGVSVLLVTSVFDVGVDFEGGVDCIINAAGSKSITKQLQRLGRGLRLQNNKWDKCLLIDFVDKNIYVKNHTEERIKIYEKEKFDVEIVDQVDLSKMFKTYYEEKLNFIQGG